MRRLSCGDHRKEKAVALGIRGGTEAVLCWVFGSALGSKVWASGSQENEYPFQENEYPFEPGRG